MPDHYNSTEPVLINFQSKEIDLEISELFVSTTADGPSYAVLNIPLDKYPEFDKFWPSRLEDGFYKLKAKICSNYGARTVDQIIVGNTYNLILKTQTYFHGRKEHTLLFVYVCNLVKVFEGDSALIFSTRSTTNNPTDF